MSSSLEGDRSGSAPGNGGSAIEARCGAARRSGADPAGAGRADGVLPRAMLPSGSVPFIDVLEEAGRKEAAWRDRGSDHPNGAERVCC
jgi:hypothetical protein